MAVDCLALSLDVTQNQDNTDRMIRLELGIKSGENEFQNSRNSMIYK
jgi:hypothetical protein